MKTAFIGHREIFVKDIAERLLIAIRTEIEHGCSVFTMGTHGEFDSLALNACRGLRKTHKDLEIEVVLTSLHSIERGAELDSVPYSDVKTVMYELEEVHFKRRITLSNRKMIDGCNALICYVDPSAYRSGAKTAMRYAQKQGLKVINLFREQDRPFYGMTEEEKEVYWKNISSNGIS